MRMQHGKFDKKGKFTSVTWERAFDEMERQLRKVHQEMSYHSQCFPRDRH
jgi:nitrate reductase NapA